MGMDIEGINPSTEEGDYFRASIWSWSPILNVARTAIKVFNLNIDTNGWDYNSGYGLRTQEECTALANAMQKLLDSTETPIITSQHSVIAQAFITAMDMSNVGPQAEIDRSEVQEFISFLRSCGGFSIW